MIIYFCIKTAGDKPPPLIKTTVFAMRHVLLLYNKLVFFSDMCREKYTLDVRE